jgi:hypothetical protein
MNSFNWKRSYFFNFSKKSEVDLEDKKMFLILGGNVSWIIYGRAKKKNR